MTGDDGHFGEEVAAHYDDLTDPMFSDEVIGPIVDRLASLGDGPLPPGLTVHDV